MEIQNALHYIGVKFATTNKGAFMKNMFDFKKLLLTSLLALVPIFVIGRPGGGDAGGAQGAIDHLGNFYFLDILSDADLAKLSFIPAKQSKIMSDIKCSSEQFRELQEYEFDRNENYESVYPAQGKFETELSEAKKLLFKAGQVLQSDFSCPALELIEGINKMPNIAYLFQQIDFRTTTFLLPQIKDSTLAHAKNQIQIAYYTYGIIYFQEQTMRRLKEKARGVFIKETLRTINSRYDLNLRNIDLEKATYYIYHSEIENFSKSMFATKMRNKFPTECREISTAELFDGDGFEKSLTRAVFPDFLSYLERTDNEKVFKVKASDGKVWSTKSGKILDINSCNYQD